eukprot:TRINITY_DN7927_c0_g1_i1.p1 TRINITY_DN7927_c0_g1~~TRINITY_DN7927_c0_g1_i1.p1  ORF type:complete len:1819 (-),score=663.72 TRINITY_DN7927_c0_g1_i1:83-5539(-)
MENIENLPYEGLNSVQSRIKEEKMAFFEVNRTPPDEKRRREKAAEMASNQVPEVLMLTPFTSSPRIEFERIKLGRSGVRRLVVRNPGDKPMEVILEKLPKEEKGFSIDYVAFRLGGREETTLLIGWTPVKGGGVRDNFIVKFGKFSAQVILIGSCIAPEVKVSKPRPTNTSMTRPLGPKNTNIKPGSKTRPSVPASKLTAAPKITIPSNPVVRKSDSPPKRLITGSSPPPLPQQPKMDSFVCGAEFNLRELPRPESDSTPRRETFVHERPQPRGGDVVESTPIVSSRTETFRDIRRETMVVEANTRLDFGYSVPSMPSMPPPQLTDVRRQTFVPQRSGQASQGMSRRQTYVKLPPQESGTIPPVERRKWSMESVDLARDPDVSGMVVGESFVSVQTPEILKRAQRTSESESASKLASEVTSPRTEDIPLNLSVAPLNLSARPKVLTDMLAQFLDNTEYEPLNLSVHAKEGSDDQTVDPPVEAARPTSVNLTLPVIEPTTQTPTIMATSYKSSPRPYCPQVSDISLPEASPCLPTPKLLGTPLKDPRLLQLMNSFNISGNGSLDLSMGSQFGDCSMVVNMASPARDREKDLEEELENIENNKESWEDAELEMIAKARGTSAQGKSQTSPQVERGDRLSSGTIVKTAPCLDPGVVPVIGAEIHQEDVVVLEERECMVVMEEEVKISEVIEEVIEYEYEIVGGERRLVGERNLGRTVSCQSETMTRTPVKSVKSTRSHVTVEPECDVSRLIEEQLSGSAPSDICVGSPTALPRPRAFDLTPEQLDTLHMALPLPTTTHPDQVFNISLHQAVQIPPLPNPPQYTYAVPTIPKSPEPMVRHLPGLRGSPRISNQMSSHPESFLQVTINETSFLPPSPDDPRRCSTGVKHKENMPVMSPSPNAEVRKSLFSPDLPKADITETQTLAQPDGDDSGFVPLNSLGYELPIIDSPSSESKCRLSSDTYIATVESPALSTIQETDETDSSKQNGTFEKNPAQQSSRPGSRVASRPQSRVGGEVSNNATAPNTTFDKSKDVDQQNSNMENKTFEKEVIVEPTDIVSEEVKTVIKERTPARPRRSNISYTPQDIATIAMSKNSVENLAMSEDNVETGLMFFPISPTQSEKRKPDMAPLSEQSKRSKTVTLASRPVVRAMKNPLPPRMTGKRLQMSQNKSVKEDVKATETTKVKELLRKPVSQSLPPKPTASRVTQPARRLHLVKTNKPGMVHHPNPFAARNQYYDERWIDKQERGFTRWLNFILTPQVLEDTTDMLPGKVDVAKLWTQCSKDVKVPRAPTREVMSMRAYTARREMNRLRRSACKIWQSREVAAVIGKVEFEIEKLRLVIRKDRNITKDVGMKQALLKIILSYNPLWLRIGLETVYGELLPVSTNSDLLGLSRFLVIRLLSNPDILAEYAHPTVPHSYRDGHQEALNRFALKKFLELVYFLDIAKETRLIRHNPCLFCPDSQFKTSRDVLLTFSKDYLAGEGDVTKHMAYMGYIVNHKQTKLDEFDYAVTNIKTDLRCGLRLVKVAELVTGVVATSNMRVPAVSRLQKVHNTEVALAAYKEGGLDMPKTITAKDIVDGHREKTLQLLWTIIFGYQLNTILDLQKLKEEIVHLKRSLAVRARMGDASAQAGKAWLAELVSRSPQQGILAGESLMLVMEWAQLVMAHYQVEVENWTVSWCDGRGLCLLVHHYQPDLLARSDIKDQTSLTHQVGNQNLDDSLDFNYGSKVVDPACYEAYIENEKANFKLLFSKVSELGGVPILITPGDMSNTIPDEKVTATFIGYLAARLLDLSREIKAARTIQLAWRRFSAVRKEEELKVKYSS